ncbi:MAG: queuine tRNA-ribosyltransferase family protein [Anaerolineae bacterium]|nr:queuine tRNA-ribosyltransferase family protein [Anaerolineae bacterium]
MTEETQRVVQSIDTGHGVLNLPVFFPDATRAVVRTVGSEDLEASAVRGLVVNVFHLSSRPGVGLIKGAGGIHPFMDWPHPVASDSGGFQLMSMIRENPKYGTITKRGIHFTDMDAGRKKVLFTPERSIRLQFDLGSDLVVCLDDCPTPDASREEVETAVERTIQWAARCKEEFDRLARVRARQGEAAPLLFGVIQGGYDRSLRLRCAEALLPMGFDGFGFGGWPLTPEGDLALDILAYTASLTPDALPRWALGIGSPEHVVRCYDAGWRIFDCVLPTRDARHGRLYAWSVDEPARAHLRGEGFYHFVYIRDDKHKRDYGPISEACDCPTCRRYSLSYVHHLFDVDDPLGLRLATMHNLRFYTQLMARLTST